MIHEYKLPGQYLRNVKVCYSKDNEWWINPSAFLAIFDTKEDPKEIIKDFDNIAPTSLKPKISEGIKRNSPIVLEGYNIIDIHLDYDYFSYDCYRALGGRVYPEGTAPSLKSVVQKDQSNKKDLIKKIFFT